MEKNIDQFWQKRFLPLAIVSVFILAALFFIVSMLQVNSLQKKIEQRPALELSDVLSEIDNSDSELDVKWKVLAYLEVHSIQNRYHQAGVLSMSRVWLIYLGFITGMVLSLIGAIFILGQIKVDPIKLKGEIKESGGMLETTSPGLVLVVLGTLLMIITLVSKSQIEVKDASIYMPIVLEGAIPGNSESGNIYKDLKGSSTSQDAVDKVDSIMHIDESYELELLRNRKKKKE